MSEPTISPYPQHASISTPSITPLDISPPVLPLALRAKNDADRLWAEHAFNEPNLLIIPAYMHSRPRTAYHTRIQMELMRNWQLDIARSITSVEEFLDTPEYEYMKERADVLGGKIWEWKREAERLEREEKPKKVKKEMVLREGAKIKAPEVNYGFGKNTVVIPFKRVAEEEMEGGMPAKRVRAEAGLEEEGETVVKRDRAEAVAEESAQEMTVLPAERVRADSVDVAREIEKEEVEKSGGE